MERDGLRCSVGPNTCLELAEVDCSTGTGGSAWLSLYATNEPVSASESSPCSHASSGSVRGNLASVTEVGRGAGCSWAWTSPSSSQGRAVQPTISSAPAPVCDARENHGFVKGHRHK